MDIPADGPEVPPPGGLLLALACLTLIGLTTSEAAAQRPLVLDFETPSVAGPERPWGGTPGWVAFAG